MVCGLGRHCLRSHPEIGLEAFSTDSGHLEEERGGEGGEGSDGLSEVAGDNGVYMSGASGNCNGAWTFILFGGCADGDS